MCVNHLSGCDALLAEHYDRMMTIAKKSELL